MRHYLILAAIVIVAACGKDSGTTTTPTTPKPTSPYTLVLDAGMVDSQKVAVGSTIPVRVKLTQSGSPAVGVQVNWKIGTGHGSVSDTATATNGSGVATVNWRLGDSALVNTLTATSAGQSVTITATGLPGAASLLTKVTADSSVVVTGGTLPITARVVDRGGNGVPNTVVTWTTTGGSLSATSTTSSGSGNVTTNFTAPASGNYVITATLPGKASVSFRVVAF